MVVTAVVTACSKCSKKEEKLTSLKLSSNEYGQSSSKVPVESEIEFCSYCDDGTPDKECGDCHNVYPGCATPDRCSEPGVASCFDCEHDEVPCAGRKLREGEKGWKEICAEKKEAQIREKVGEETIKDLCMHENTHNEYNSYGKLQKRCNCGQWLGGVLIKDKKEVVSEGLPSLPCQDDYIEDLGPPVFPSQEDPVFPESDKVVVPFEKAFEFPKYDEGPGYYSFDIETPKDDIIWGPGEGKDPTPVECKAHDLSCADCDLPGPEETERPCL